MPNGNLDFFYLKDFHHEHVIVRFPELNGFDILRRLTSGHSGSGFFHRFFFFDDRLFLLFHKVGMLFLEDKLWVVTDLGCDYALQGFKASFILRIVPHISTTYTFGLLEEMCSLPSWTRLTCLAFFVIELV